MNFHSAFLSIALASAFTFLSPGCSSPKSNKKPVVSENRENDGGIDGTRKGKQLGAISDEQTDIPNFKAHSSFMLASPPSANAPADERVGSTTIFVQTYGVPDNFFKDVKSSVCKAVAPGPGIRNINMQQIIVSMVGLPPDDPQAGSYVIESSGFPRVDRLILSAFRQGILEMPQALAGFTNVSLSTDTIGARSGTIEFASGKRPAKLGDSYEAIIDATFENGKKYKAKISGSVSKLPSAPEGVYECPDGQYPHPVYE